MLRRHLLALAALLGALTLAGCTATAPRVGDGSAASGSGVTVYGTVDAGVSRSSR